MDLNNMNEDWKKEAPKLAAMEKANPFTVPDNYFHHLSKHLQARVKIDEIAADKPAAFKVPENYFETLEERISASIAVDKLKEETLTEGFTVPDGYFATLQEEILQKTAGATIAEAKVRTLLPKWMKIVAAACITAVVGFGIYNYQSSGPDVDHQLSTISEEEIVDYLQAYSTPADGAVIAEYLSSEGGIEMGSNLSEDEIQEYLDSTF